MKIRRTNLFTFSAQPWLCFEDDPNAGNGGGVTPKVNEHGFPDATPVADMAPEHQAAYWKHQSRKHEARANSATPADELKRLQERDAKLKELEDAQLSTDEKARQDVATATQTAAQAQATAEAATRRALLLEVALEKGLTVDQAARLQGTTKDELAADADSLKTLFGASTSGGNSGTPTPRLTPGGREPGAAKTVQAGASRYKSPYGGTN